jgi:general secretion pathway protein A
MLGALGAWLYLPRPLPASSPASATAGPATVPHSGFPETLARSGKPAIAQTGGLLAAPVTAAATVATTSYSSADALRELASLWSVSLAPGQGCDDAARLNLRCYEGKGGLDELRLLDRPALLTLRDNSALPLSYALLTALDGRFATLRIRGKSEVLSLEALAARFDGSFITFWRKPRAWRDEVKLGDRGPDVDWVAKRLAQLNNLARPEENTALDAGTQALLQKFQASQKLEPDGVAGPKTFMRLIQLGGGVEPRLLGSAAQPSTVAGK